MQIQSYSNELWSSDGKSILTLIIPLLAFQWWWAHPLSGNFQLGEIEQELNYVRKFKQEKKHCRKNIHKVVIKDMWPENSLVHLVFLLLRNADFQVVIWMPFAKTFAFITLLVFLRRIKRIDSFCIWYLHSHASYLASELGDVCFGRLYQKFLWMLFEKQFLSWNEPGIKLHWEHLFRAI